MRFIVKMTKAERLEIVFRAIGAFFIGLFGFLGNDRLVMAFISLILGSIFLSVFVERRKR